MADDTRLHHTLTYGITHHHASPHRLCTQRTGKERPGRDRREGGGGVGQGPGSREEWMTSTSARRGCAWWVRWCSGGQRWAGGGGVGGCTFERAGLIRRLRLWPWSICRGSVECSAEVQRCRGAEVGAEQRRAVHWPPVDAIHSPVSIPPLLHYSALTIHGSLWSSPTQQHRPSVASPFTPPLLPPAGSSGSAVPSCPLCCVFRCCARLCEWAQRRWAAAPLCR